MKIEESKQRLETRKYFDKKQHCQNYCLWPESAQMEKELGKLKMVSADFKKFDFAFIVN